MQQDGPRPTLGSAIFFGIAFVVGSYFTFAAVQGNHGLFQRIETQAEIATLRETRDRLASDLAHVQNRTLRMSDGFLDLDLLDQQVRDVLGWMRADELVVR
ncbi:MAG: FtsB family cell division protein [Alkalilacustris sp.]